MLVLIRVMWLLFGLLVLDKALLAFYHSNRWLFEEL